MLTNEPYCKVLPLMQCYHNTNLTFSVVLLDVNNLSLVDTLLRHALLKVPWLSGSLTLETEMLLRDTKSKVAAVPKLQMAISSF